MGRSGPKWAARAYAKTKRKRRWTEVDRTQKWAEDPRWAARAAARRLPSLGFWIHKWARHVPPEALSGFLAEVSFRNSDQFGSVRTVYLHFSHLHFSHTPRQ